MDSFLAVGRVERGGLSDQGSRGVQQIETEALGKEDEGWTVNENGGQ